MQWRVQDLVEGGGGGGVVICRVGGVGMGVGYGRRGGVPSLSGRNIAKQLIPK